MRQRSKQSRYSLRAGVLSRAFRAPGSCVQSFVIMVDSYHLTLERQVAHEGFKPSLRNRRG